jgi:hypothetical protein
VAVELVPALAELDAEGVAVAVAAASLGRVEEGAEEQIR